MEPMKDGLGPDAIRRIAQNLKRGDPKFPASRFIKLSCEGLETLELKARVHHIIEALHATLPTDFERAVAVLLAAQPSWNAGPQSNVSGFAAWPVIDFVSVYGTDHFDVSMGALRQLTSLFTAEFAVRPFIAADQKRAFGHIEKWAKDADHRVRRLASEGARPRLPWGMRLRALQADPSPSLPILSRLKDDDEDFVRRSVANHLNDIAKDHPARVVELCAAWQKGASANRRWIIRHALRGLVKNGDPKALGVLGFDHGARVKVQGFKVTPKRLRVGDDLSFHLKLLSDAPREQSLVVDYAIHHVKKAGGRTAKVFKLKTFQFEARGVTTIGKIHKFRPITTRVYHPGMHAVEILINGKAVAFEEFYLGA